MRVFCIDAFFSLLIISNFVVWGLVLTRFLEWLQ
jgi:hypothetical protein